MTRNMFLSIFLLSFSGITLAATSFFPLPETPADESHPNALIAYNAQCSEWGNENGTIDKAAYIQWCKDQIARVWTVGYDNTDSGGE